MLRASYPQLWAKAQADIAAGNTFYNNGNGTTTFGIGDMRGRVPAGKDDMGGTAANRLTSGGSGVNGAALGAVGGAETHTLTASQLAPHPHSGTTGGMSRNNPHVHGSVTASYRTGQFQQGTSYFKGWSDESTSGSFVSTSSADINHEHPFTTNGGDGVVGAPHNNTQPTMVCNYLLYVGA